MADQYKTSQGTGQNQVPRGGDLGGFHVNLRIETLDENLEQYVVSPTTPSRVFAGVN